MPVEHGHDVVVGAAHRRDDRDRSGGGDPAPWHPPASQALVRPCCEGRDHGSAILVTLEVEIVLLAHVTILQKLRPRPTDYKPIPGQGERDLYTASFAPMNPSSTARAVFAWRCLRSGLPRRRPFSFLGTAGTRPQLEFMGWRVPSLVVM